MRHRPPIRLPAPSPTRGEGRDARAGEGSADIKGPQPSSLIELPGYA